MARDHGDAQRNADAARCVWPSLALAPGSALLFSLYLVPVASGQDLCPDGGKVVSHRPSDPAFDPQGPALTPATPAARHWQFCEVQTPAGHSTPHGPISAWYLDWQLAHEGSYFWGQRSGPWVFWYSDGQVWAKGTYEPLIGDADRAQAGAGSVGSLKVGTWSTWYASGLPRSIGAYLGVNDVTQGRITMVPEDEADLVFGRGVRDGDWVVYDEGAGGESTLMYELGRLILLPGSEQLPEPARPEGSGARASEANSELEISDPLSGEATLFSARQFLVVERQARWTYGWAGKGVRSDTKVVEVPPRSVGVGVGLRTTLYDTTGEVPPMAGGLFFWFLGDGKSGTPVGAWMETGAAGQPSRMVLPAEITEGATWSDSRVRDFSGQPIAVQYRIVAVDVAVELPTGRIYTGCVQVEGVQNGATASDYYAPGIGHLGTYVAAEDTWITWLDEFSK